MMPSHGTIHAPVLAALALLAFGATVVMAQPPPMMGAMPKIPTVELTDQSAKNAVDAYLTLREKYKDKIPPTNEVQGMAEGMQAAGDIRAVVTAKGFKSAHDWHKAITSVAMAYGFSKQGNAGDMDKKIAELEADTQIPAAYKQQMLDTMKSMRPSENNLAVLKRLLADPTYREKIETISK